jgi:hypothetical protein
VEKGFIGAYGLTLGADGPRLGAYNGFLVGERFYRCLKVMPFISLSKENIN